jgi:hypothetical protein
MEEANLYLTRWGHGDDHRFAALFQKAWHRVPAAERTLLTQYWGHQGYAHGQVCGKTHPAGPGSSSPRIELVAGWKDRDSIILPSDWDQCEAAAGEVFACGYLMRFCALCIDLMPPDVVQDVIGQQLAQCWQFADSVLNGKLRWWDQGGLAPEAAAIMVSWGFNPAAAAGWFAHDNRAVAV